MAISRTSGNGAAEQSRKYLTIKQEKECKCSQIRFTRTRLKIKDQAKQTETDKPLGQKSVVRWLLMSEN